MSDTSQWARRLSRLRSMSAEELLDRARQHVTARVDAIRCRRGHDLAGPVPDSVSPTGRFLFVPSEIETLCALLRQQLPQVAAAIVACAERICSHRFDLLGYENLDYGAEIDWHLDLVHEKRGPAKPWCKVNYLSFDEVGDAKITWELNRHQHLVTLAKAYWLTGDEKFARAIVTQWISWHAANPYPVGMNWASSLEVAFRSLSWIWVYILLQDSPLMTPDLRRQWFHALALSGRHIDRYLSTYFSPNTHLLGEGLALFFLGTLFSQFPRAARWKRRGWDIILKAASTQVRSDGFYFEQSTYYHVYALDMFLHARTLAAANDVPIPAEFDAVILKMLDVLLLLGRGGLVPCLGDDDGGRLFDPSRNHPEHLLDPLSTGAVLFARGDFKFFAGSLREETLWLLGAAGLRAFEELKHTEPSTASVALPQSGLYLMADAESGQQLSIDAGPHGPGHGHADALSLTLIQNGRVVLADPGTYEYVGPSDERSHYRGTAAHNALRVDGLDQAESVGPFSWKNPPVVRTERWVAGQHFDLFAGRHNGYARLPQPVEHERWVFHRKEQFWLVRDVVTGEGKHQLELTWHLGPTMSAASTKDNLFADGQDGLGLITVHGHGWWQSAHRDYSSPVYGRAERAMVLTFGATTELPAEFVTLLLPTTSLNASLGRLDRLSSTAAVQSYHYARDAQEHHFFFAKAEGSWSSSNWTSDARFLYWSWDRRQDLRLLVVCGGSFAEIGGVRLLTSATVVDYAEVMSAAGQTQLFSSEPDRVSLLNSLDRVEMELAASGNHLKRSST